MTRVKFIVVGAVIGCWCPGATAIVNIESNRMEDPSQGWSGQVNFLLMGNLGNTEDLDLAFGARAVHRDGAHRWLLVADQEYGESAEEEDTDSTKVHVRRVYETGPRHAWEGFTQYERDDFRLLGSRLLAGAGHRFTFLPNSERHRHYLGVGAFGEREREDLAGAKNIERTVRGNLYWSYRYQWREEIHLANTLYVQPSFEAGDDYRLLDNLSLSIGVGERLSLQLAVDWHYDSEPPATVEQTDISYTTSLVWRLGK